MAIVQGKPTGSRVFANFANGILDGYVQGRGMAQADREEQRSVEVQQAELKNQQLTQQIEQAKMNEFNAQAQLRQRLLEAQVKIAETKDPMAVKQAQVDKAKYEAEAAHWRAQREQLEYEQKKQIHDLTDLMNKLRQGGAQSGMPGPMSQGPASSFLPSMDTESSYDTGGDTDPYANMPAVEPGAQPTETALGDQGSQATVPGGRRVLTGPPQPGNQMELEETVPITRPGDVARTILPPVVGPTSTPRELPIMDTEVEDALKSKNINDAMKKLLSTDGVAFGAEMQKLKDENPGKYAEQAAKLVDENEKQHPDVYRAFRQKGTSSSRLREIVMGILTDPNERAAVNPQKDVDSAVAEGVAELSMENLLSPDSKSRLRTYLAVDAANNGDIARYNGRRLNEALDETFGPSGQYVRFSDDLDYTLRQLIQALYTDEMSASGNALLGYTEPILTSYKRSGEHKAMAMLDAYWRPLRELEGRGREQARMSHIPRFGNRHF